MQTRSMSTLKSEVTRAPLPFPIADGNAHVFLYFQESMGGSYHKVTGLAVCPLIKKKLKEDYPKNIDQKGKCRCHFRS